MWPSLALPRASLPPVCVRALGPCVCVCSCCLGSWSLPGPASASCPPACGRSLGAFVFVFALVALRPGPSLALPRASWPPVGVWSWGPCVFGSWSLPSGLLSARVRPALASAFALCGVLRRSTMGNSGTEQHQAPTRFFCLRLISGSSP